ncbi:MAG TPA: NfeD family protein [Candidatus Mediterraneibacter stercoripullorum]|nr:NfeD family protein [Candidatus Mediterraneibacter stercoripullorum]
MEKEVFLWLGLMIIFLIIELLTVGLTCIWLAGGSLAALLVSLTGANIVWQVLMFILVSFLLVVFTRPFAMKYINARHERTNVDELIGKLVKVTETVDNYEQTGAATANGLDWTARSEDDRETIEKGSLARVVRISGVKLILKKSEEGKS